MNDNKRRKKMGCMDAEKNFLKQKSVYSGLLRYAEEENPFVYSYLGLSTLIETAERNVICISFTSERSECADLLVNKVTMQFLESALRDIGASHYKLRFYVEVRTNDGIHPH